MYEPSRNIMSFHIAGFQFWDGALVLDQLKVGTQLRLVPEFDNPHDPCAVAIYFGETKLGFVPSDENGLISQLLFYGHNGILECRVLQVAAERSPWHQVRAGVYLVDAR
ncbi:HIRAN domain-containing protein [Enorma phocaeensis]|uniref:HIRAN domain-containing protein n=1 Tax=Enorma phocaeensis TaxID=1871019 RepID=A0A921IVA2_9ACTN|nr:HIRAN domain-containing protein [Enorma phocaeensis]HJG36690.1 HIRAN domain-containing protein [Enorma phocaeensis]